MYSPFIYNRKSLQCITMENIGRSPISALLGSTSASDGKNEQQAGSGDSSSSLSVNGLQIASGPASGPSPQVDNNTQPSPGNNNGNGESSLPGLGPQRRRPPFKYKYVVEKKDEFTSAPFQRFQTPNTNGETQQGLPVVIPSSIRKFQSIYPVDPERLRVSQQQQLEGTEALKASTSATGSPIPSIPSTTSAPPIAIQPRPAAGLKGQIRITKYPAVTNDDQTNTPEQKKKAKRAPRTSISSLIHSGEYLEAPKRARVVPNIPQGTIEVIDVEDTEPSVPAVTSANRPSESAIQFVPPNPSVSTQKYGENPQALTLPTLDLAALRAKLTAPTMSVFKAEENTEEAPKKKRGPYKRKKEDTPQDKPDIKRKADEKAEGTEPKKKRVMKPKAEKKPKAKKKDVKQELQAPPKEAKDPIHPTMTTDKATVGGARVPSPSLVTTERDAAQERPTIILDIPLLDPKDPKPGKAEVVIDVLKLAEDKYGWSTIHPDAKSAIDIMDEMIEDDEDGVEVDNDGEEADDKESEKPKDKEKEKDVDNDTEMENVEKTKDKDNEKEKKDKRKDDEDLTEEQLVRRHEAKMNRKVGKYDYEDPFIDDEELQWEEEIASTKEGFFVYWGPLVDDRTKSKKKK